MSTKDTTPLGSDAETSSAAAAAADKKDTTVPTFTEKEERVMKIAWTCLKSGPPDVDIAKLTKAAGFNTTKTAANTWGAIKKKLLSMGGDGGEEGVEGQDAPKTPKAKATPKKRGKKGDADGEADAEAGAGAGAEDGSPKKKQRKTPVKKGKKAAEEEEAAGIKGEDMDEAA
ncbi:hypothetical protein KC331_g6331 [Hortaea werneckii]|uniref:Myb-like domain-containing protein n=1 Tax=Hortaea werneckii TaxID=91943 RepID=A0A3M7CH95_HORWE|nr:hypothetical protein KC331_g6331 [Hortaea werneckii]KAI7715694.1 hypothetical protein KC353_g5889 [Hortaea werneckii]RMY51240.1 hypothetical protein D0865_06468 [Hortaea werneckii]